jgi:hypothetical protein
MKTFIKQFKTYVGHCDLAEATSILIVEKMKVFIYCSIAEAIYRERKQADGDKYAVEIHFQSTPEDERRLTSFRNREAARWEQDKASDVDGWSRRIGKKESEK